MGLIGKLPNNKKRFIIIFVILYAIFLLILRYKNIYLHRLWELSYNPTGVFTSYFLYFILPLILFFTLLFLGKKTSKKRL